MSRSQYSETFVEPSVAQTYERLYAPGSADEALWKIERSFLAEFYERHRARWPNCSYLDFACGTGRVIAFLEDRVATSTGIDISPEMLKIAGTKLHRSKLICQDVVQDSLGERVYDFITAFRFFLNSEPPVRLQVMRELARALRNEDSRLVFNNHGNPWSFKAVAWPVHRARQLLRGRPAVGNYLSHRQVEELVGAAGLQIVERTGCGLVSPRLFKVASSLSGRMEAWFGRGRAGKAFGVDQIYVVARA